MEESPMPKHLRLVERSHENRSVPVRPANAELRSREYLTAKEVEKLIKVARDGRYGHRDGTLILVAFRHGLRATEICDLERSQVEFGRSASLPPQVGQGDRLIRHNRCRYGLRGRQVGRMFNRFEF
jgi:integrase